MYKYNVSADKLKLLKIAAQYAGLNWRSIAARPGTVDQFISDVGEAMAIDKMNESRDNKP